MNPVPSTAQPGWDLQASLAYWSRVPALWSVWLTAIGSRESIEVLAARRFADLVRFARTRSRYYAESYRSLPEAGFEPRHVPPATRHELMSRFDEWMTDPEATRESVDAFIADPAGIGRPYLGRYAVWASSGTTGEPGLFVHDGPALAVYDALETVRLGRGVLAPAFAMNLALAGGRYAMIGATGGHFAGAASVERLRQMAPVLADRLRVFSILETLPKLVEMLNEYQPSFIGSYPTAASLLAGEQHRGRLRLRPSVIWVGGETLSAACRAEIGAAFECEVEEAYGASESMSIACACSRGWLHLNSDWVMLEPVDRHYRPVAPGETSHTALLTNLANRVQPIIRYDLGDSVMIKPEPCACGSPFPAVRVEGRSDEVLSMRNANGDRVDLLPLALTTVMEDIAGAHRFQLVQTAPDALGVRVKASDGADDPALWRKAARSLRAYLDAQGLRTVTIHRDTAPLERGARSGKLRRVISIRAGCGAAAKPG